MYTDGFILLDSFIEEKPILVKKLYNEDFVNQKLLALSNEDQFAFKRSSVDEFGSCSITVFPVYVNFLYITDVVGL